jgi:hypothetical protein
MEIKEVRFCLVKAKGHVIYSNVLKNANLFQKRIITFSKAKFSFRQPSSINQKNVCFSCANLLL